MKCDCLNDCGDDPRLKAGTVVLCARRQQQVKTEARAKALYDACPTVKPTWEQLGPTCQSVWLEYAIRGKADAVSNVKRRVNTVAASTPPKQRRSQTSSVSIRSPALQATAQKIRVAAGNRPVPIQRRTK